MSLFAELRRRNVFRVGIAYGLIAWVLLQGADFALDVVEAPNWVIQALVALALLGLPAALVFAWVFEMTPEGLRRETEIDRTRSIAPQTGRKLDRVIIGVLVLAVAVLLLERSFEAPDQAAPVANPVANRGGAEAEPAEPPRDAPPEPAVSDRRSVAVLPFDFRSSNPEDEFFAEGVHDDLLTQLAKIGSLKVISRTSVMEYKDTTKKIPEIAGELGVATIVEGGVQRSGTRVRINAQLIDATSDEHLWAETFDRELTAENLFDIQAEIARAIAGALHATLSPREQQQLGRVLTRDLRAWELYQRGKRYLTLQDPVRIGLGLQDVEQALVIDPRFAAAYALKAILLMQQYWFLEQDPSLTAGALEAIEAGRAIDPDLGELHLAEAVYHYWGFLDYERALAALDRAMPTLENDILALKVHAWVLRRRGEIAESAAIMERVAELDPRDAQNWSELGSTLGSLRRMDEAETALGQAMTLAPANVTVLSSVADTALFNKADPARALQIYSRIASSDMAPEFRESWLTAFFMARDFEGALETVEQWPDSMLDVRVFRVTKALLRGRVLANAGRDDEAAEPLREARSTFERLAAEHPDDHRIAISLCQVHGALRDAEAAREQCAVAKARLHRDAFRRKEDRFYLAEALALAGANDAALDLVEESMAAPIGPNFKVLELHPAFDGLRDEPRYAELAARYREASE